MKPIETIMRTAPVIPVLVIDDIAHAQPIAEALVAGGLRVLEVTLRTPCALDAIAAMKKIEGAVVGAGTVVDEEGLKASIAAGADFVVSPGLTEQLGRVVVANNIPFLPGIADAGDIMRGLDLGLRHFKFFPAEASGGIKTLKALVAPFYQCLFCPTGGITETSAIEWLALDAVPCVGGSWLLEEGAPDATKIRRAAEAARRLAC